MTDVETSSDAASLVGALADPLRRGSALAGLVSLGPSARGAVRSGLGDGRWEVRRACVYWHLRFPDAEDVRWLGPLARDPKSKVRHAAIVALAQAPGIARSEVAALLMERALTDESLHVRRQAVLLLAWQLAHPDLEGFFAGLLATEGDAKLHKFAGIGLVRCRERAARARAAKSC
jgi:HEAT repeats